jgi:Flp pilus assembly protein TadG
VALVEFALIVPAFFMLMVGMFTGALAYNDQIGLTQAAREGARYGATLPLATSNNQWAANAQAVVYQRSGGSLTATNGQVCVSLVSGVYPNVVVHADPGDPVNQYTTSSSGTPCIPNDGNTDGCSRVQVTVQKPSKLQAVLFTMSLNLTSRAVVRYEVTSC